MCELLESSLGKRGYSVVSVQSGEAALAKLEAPGEDEFDVVITDLNMRGMRGNELCARIVAGREDLPVLVLTAFGSLDAAVEAIRAGAYDFLTKPVQIGALGIAIERAIEHRRLRVEVRQLRRAVEHQRGFDDMIGQSPTMRQVYDLLDRVAGTDASVLITGESGTGKEVVARALHRRGQRKDGPFVAINCAAMPESLLESELFGHAKGAFTDAKTARAGLFVQAHKGTLLLDEIGEMPLGLQPKLLRAIQERVVRPVGSTQEVPFDARIITATHRDLEGLVEEKRFREDLFFRINVIQLKLPPLRARGSDVLLLAQHFIERFAERMSKPVVGLSPQAAQKLLAYSWPGNVRELSNAMERGVALTRSGEVGVADLPEKITEYRTSHVVIASDDPTELVPLEEVERRYILRVLEACGGNQSSASRVLGLDRKTLRRKLDKYEGRKSTEE